MPSASRSSSDCVIATLKRLLSSLPWVLVNIQAVLALVYPHSFSYLRWLLLALYVLVSWNLFSECRSETWIFSIIKDNQTRVAHGLEHATLNVLVEHDVPVRWGATHGSDRFMIMLERGNEARLSDIRIAASAAIRRVMCGERSLLYHWGCGTSDLVAAIGIWAVLLTAGLAAGLLGGSSGVAFALLVTLGNLWRALNVNLGLVAQRLFTVSSRFTSARVVDVRLVGTRKDEVVFEVVLAVHAASEGGLVIPNIG